VATLANKIRDSIATVLPLMVAARQAEVRDGGVSLRTLPEEVVLREELLEFASESSVDIVVQSILAVLPHSVFM
jgi:hypothetical protein